MTRFGRFPLALLLTAALAAVSSAGVVRLVPEAALAPLGVPQVLVGSPGSAPLALTNAVSARDTRWKKFKGFFKDLLAAAVP
ncbi:MAG: hypothetical protein HY923_00475 [Elusimicrobia bacterium]|nr:hypothetical protein [Elusimicrobiota bacterium]